MIPSPYMPSSNGERDWDVVFGMALYFLWMNMNDFVLYFYLYISSLRQLIA